jgi:hypothetical protein
MSTSPTEKKWDISQIPTFAVLLTTDNDLIYEQFSPENEDDAVLIESIREHGIKEPLVISADGFLLSGHRRLEVARYLCLSEVPVRRENIEFLVLEDAERLKILKRFNQQRSKSFEERVRERLVDIDPEEAYERGMRKKLERADANAEIDENIDIGFAKRRSRITTLEFLNAVKKVIQDNKPYWPLTDRRVHYLLLNNPPRRHDKKPGRYKNDKSSYKALCNLLTRARLEGSIPMRALEDPTRPVEIGNHFDSAEAFVECQLDLFLDGYSRNLMQSQLNHVEIVLEKSALRSIVSTVAGEYCISLVVSRGYCSLAPRMSIASRFKKTNKDTLILLFLTDFDPDGEEIAASFCRSLQSDFGISNLIAHKVLLSSEDVRTYNLPSDLDAKPSSPQYQKFVRKYGTKAVELDAAPVELIQNSLRKAIEGCIDLELFNQEIDASKIDYQSIETQKRELLNFLRSRS